MATFPASFAISPVSTRNRHYKTLTAQFGDGYRQSVPDGINYVIDEWNITTVIFEQAERDDNVTFLDSVGSYSPITWQAPGDTTSKNWKITPDGWSQAVLGSNLYQLSFKLIQDY